MNEASERWLIGASILGVSFLILLFTVHNWHIYLPVGVSALVSFIVTIVANNDNTTSCMY